MDLHRHHPGYRVRREVSIGLGMILAGERVKARVPPGHLDYRLRVEADFPDQSTRPTVLSPGERISPWDSSQVPDGLYALRERLVDGADLDRYISLFATIRVENDDSPQLSRQFLPVSRQPREDASRWHEPESGRPLFSHFVPGSDRSPNLSPSRSATRRQAREQTSTGMSAPSSWELEMLTQPLAKRYHGVPSLYRGSTGQAVCSPRYTRRGLARFSNCMSEWMFMTEKEMITICSLEQNFILKPDGPGYVRLISSRASFFE